MTAPRPTSTRAAPPPPPSSDLTTTDSTSDADAQLIDLEVQLARALRSARRSPTPGTDQVDELATLRAQYRDAVEARLLRGQADTDDKEMGEGARPLDERVWRLGFYPQIEALRAAAKRPGTDRTPLLRSLDHASGFFALVIAHIRATQLNNDKDDEDDEDDGRSRDAAIQTVRRCLIYLGDLARYREAALDRRTWSAPAVYYQQAIALDRTRGRAYGQLAMVDVQRGDLFSAVANYLRSTGAVHPFPVSLDNLRTLFRTHWTQCTPLLHFVARVAGLAPDGPVTASVLITSYLALDLPTTFDRTQAGLILATLLTPTTTNPTTLDLVAGHVARALTFTLFLRVAPARLAATWILANPSVARSVQSAARAHEILVYLKGNVDVDAVDEDWCAVAALAPFYATDDDGPAAGRVVAARAVLDADAANSPAAVNAAVRGTRALRVSAARRARGGGGAGRGCGRGRGRTVVGPATSDPAVTAPDAAPPRILAVVTVEAVTDAREWGVVETWVSARRAVVCQVVVPAAVLDELDARKKASKAARAATRALERAVRHARATVRVVPAPDGAEVENVRALLLASATDNDNDLVEEETADEESKVEDEAVAHLAAVLATARSLATPEVAVAVVSRDPRAALVGATLGIAAGDAEMIAAVVEQVAALAVDVGAAATVGVDELDAGVRAR
ncbi:Smg-6, nonsense mediated mRNA decay factor [Allomyces javanicus]|nr:Smg-6, nonsense mediated mRNA decay factor [Allomyces javanicus]